MQLDPSLSPELIEYFYTNYTDCPKDDSYFATWQFIAGFMHTIMVIQSPLVVFTGYCIIKKTPKAMGSLKWAMLNLHCWSTYIDILFCSLLTPYLMLPVLGGFSCGLLRFLNVPIPIQVYVGLMSIGFMFNAISALFENRSSSFEINRFRFERSSTRFAFFLFNGTLTAVALIPLFQNLPDQNAAKMGQLTNIPCPHIEFFKSPVFILIADQYWARYLALVLTTQWLWIFLSILFFIGLITYHIFYSTTVNYSNATRNLQRMFFIGNLTQVAIPSVFWAAPGFGVMFLVRFHYYSQSMDNIGVAFVSLHGLASMITTLLMHSPYRNYIKELVWGRVEVVLRSPSTAF